MNNTINKYSNLIRHPRGNEPENTSLVGSVTTWFPSSSTIQVGNTPQSENNENKVVSTPRPQHVEFIGGRKYLVIPKHNVLSFSPTIATAANTPAARPNIDSNNPTFNHNLTADVPEVDSASGPNSTQLSEITSTPQPDMSSAASSHLIPDQEQPADISDPSLNQEKSAETEHTAATQDVAEEAPSKEDEAFPAPETIE